MLITGELVARLYNVIEGCLNLFSHWEPQPVLHPYDKRVFKLTMDDCEVASFYYDVDDEEWRVYLSNRYNNRRDLNALQHILDKLNEATAPKVKPPDKTLREWAKLSLDLQDAVNGSGVTSTLYAWLCSPVARQLGSTKLKNRHPITQMILYKLADLAGMEYTFAGPVYDDVKRLAGVETTELEGDAHAKNS